MICVKCRRGEVANPRAMKPRPRPPLRHCPICGVAMQASKSRDDLLTFDTFQCFTCNTTIVEEARPPQGESNGGGDGR